MRSPVKMIILLLAITCCGGCGLCKRYAIPRINIPRVESDFIPDAITEKFPWTEIASQIVFSGDWMGEVDYPGYRTEVKLCWSPNYLYIMWEASYDKLGAVSGEPIGRGESWNLWKGDAVELFIGDSPDHKRYFEFVATPLNQWVDIRHNKNVLLGEPCDYAWESGWKRAVLNDAETKRWIAEWRIPLGAITTQAIGKNMIYRGNFYRTAVQDDGQMLYLSWNPTLSGEKPSFHVPERFGIMIFQGKCVHRMN